MADTFIHEGREYSFEEIEKILGQHEKARERAKLYKQDYDPVKAKKQRDARMATLKQDPEKWALYESYQKAMRDKRSAMLKACQAFAREKRSQFEKFVAASEEFADVKLPA